MNLIKLLAILDGSQRDFGNGAIVCLVAILIVFSVLLVIILATSVVSIIINKLQSKAKVEPVMNNPVSKSSLAIDVNDEDMMAAILVATIDYRNEVKQDVRVVSVREVK